MPFYEEQLAKACQSAKLAIPCADILPRWFVRSVGCPALGVQYGAYRRSAHETLAHALSSAAHWRSVRESAGIGSKTRPRP